MPENLWCQSYPPIELGITGEREDEEAAKAESCLAKFKDFRYATLKDCQIYGSKSALIGKISWNKKNLQDLLRRGIGKSLEIKNTWQDLLRSGIEKYCDNIVDPSSLS